MAAVAWVAGSSVTTGSTTTVAATTPAGIANGDTLLCAIFARSVVTAPAGWTLLDQSADFTQGSITQRIYLFSKDTVTSADSSQSVTWTQASALTLGILYAVARNVSSIVVGKAAVNSTTTFTITPAASTADANWQVILLVASTINQPFGTPTVPSGTTAFATPASGRMAGSYMTADFGQSNSGSFVFGAPTTTNGLGALTVRLITSTPPDTEARIAVATPLGAPALVGLHSAVARASAETMLGAFLGFSFFDFAALVAGQTPRYLMTLTTPGGQVTAPISSWQATLQKDAACYVQCVVPACEPYVDDITAATAFAIYRTGTVLGVAYAYEMANATVESTQLSQGPRLYTALISGHSPAFAVDAGLPSSLDRPLADVRSVATETTGLRVRCAIDWLLRPGMNATLNATPFVVGTIGYYVADSDQYMDVRESVV